MALLPRRGDDKLLDTLLSLRAEAIRSRKKVENEGRWKECEKSYANRNYEGVARMEWQSACDAPMTWESIERTVPILTDNKPKLNMTGRGPEDALAVEHLQIGADVEMDKQQMQIMFPKVLRESLKIGTSFILTRLTMRAMKVKLVSEHVSAWNAYADPLATCDNDLSYMFIKRSIRMSQALQLWPDRAKAILDAANNDGTGRDPRVRLSTLSDGVSPNPGWGETTSASGETEVMEITRSGKHPSLASQFVDVWEGYFVDGDMLDIEIELDDGSTEIVQQERYPGGRIITMIGDLILEDIDNPFQHRQIPITRIVCYDQPGRYYGQSFIEALLDPHKTISMIDNKIIDQLVMAGDPERIVDDDSGVDTESDFSVPGKVVTIKPGARYEWREAPPTPSYVWNLRDAKVSEFNNAVGINEIAKGNLNTLEDVSGTAIENANAQNNTRLRLIQKNFEFGVSRWGKQTVANMGQFWSREDWLRILPPGTQILGWENWSEDDWQDWPDVVMTVGSSLPVNKAQLQNKYIMLYREGILGEPGSPEAASIVLDAIDLPNKDRALASVQKAYAMRKQMEQMQMMGQQAGPPPQAPPSGGLDKAMGGEPDAEEAYQDEVRLAGQGAGAEPSGFGG